MTRSPASDRYHPRYAHLWSMLQSELAPFPGRAAAVWRYVAASAVVIVIAMALRVPFLALSLILVFFTAQENLVLTKLSGIVLTVGATIAIALSILLLKFTFDYPLLRILGASIMVFCGMYFLRIGKFGAIGYLVALVVIYSQSLVDIFDDPEVLTRGMLWVWVAVIYPVAITIAVNYLLLPARPGQLLNREFARQIDEVIEQLEARRRATAAPRLSLAAVERGVLTLHRHLTFATIGEQRYRSEKTLHMMRIATVDRLHTAAAQLSRIPPSVPSGAQRELIVRLHKACRDLQQTIGGSDAFFLSPDVVGDRLADGTLNTELQEMAHALESLSEAECTPIQATPAAREPLIAADALSNPVYAQFALKTLLAALSCYVFYTAAQWPGIHTAMLTCVIVALPSLGASSHRGLLRVLGLFARQRGNAARHGLRHPLPG